jgi:hypothetical protein
MAIESLFLDYVQKSRLFMYPALGIKRGGSVTPIETYVSLKDYYDETDHKLICLYHLRDDTEFKNFEKTNLLGNPKFYDFKQVEEGKGIYVFDFSSDKEDWDNFIVGHYSKLSEAHKKKVQAFFGNAGSNYAYIQSYLYPDRYYAMYAEILAEKKDRESMMESLRHAVELCEKPDWKLERLEITIKNLEIKS